MKYNYLWSILLCCLFYQSEAQVNARLLQHPDVSESQITFSYGGDIWVAPKEGGNAIKLTSPSGIESFPRFSPDGKQIAFSGNYDGNTDIYVLPSGGGVPTRVTHHGMNDRMVDWFPDGKYILGASSRESGKQRWNQLYKISATGGLPEKLPMEHAEFGSLSSDGNQIAFVDRTRLFRTWKRYRGGTAADIWIFNLKTMASENITQNTANDELPMWKDDVIYYLSDNGPMQRFNIWKYDTKSKKHKQITNFKKFDIHFPAIGPKDIVFEAEGKLFLLDLATENIREVKITVVTDLITLKPKKESVEKFVQNMNLSPDGNRAIVEARGEIFSLPSSKGIVKNLTNTPGTAERFPAWSPNGQYVAYWSDATGEYELHVKDMSKGGKSSKWTNLGPGFRYNLYWSPDSKKLAFVDQTMHINIFNQETGMTRAIDQDLTLFEGGLRGWSASWSHDSQWLTYSRSQDNGNGAIMIYNTKSGKLHQATRGFYSDINPVFDPTGKYLYLVTNRSFRPVYSDFDNSWSYPNATHLAMIPLRDDIESPMAVENDTVAMKIEEEKEESKEKEMADSGKDKEKEEMDTEEDKGVDIDFENFERRLVVLPPDPGNMGNLTALEGKVVFMRYPNSGSSDGASELKYFDIKEKEEKTIFSGANGYVVSADGKKVLIRQGQNIGIVSVGPDQKMKDKLNLSKMEMTVDPQKEWKQIFTDAWRFQRDFFYDKKMHGLDWDAIREQYGAMIDNAITREDVNFILGEMIGELNASHTYKGGGDQEYGSRKAVGYLGVDWAQEKGQFKIKNIVRGAAWDNETRSPLDEPGVDVSEGDFVLAVNGIRLTDYPDPWAAFEGLADETVELTISKTGNEEDAKQVLVKTMRDETRLRNLAWIESNRKRVEEASGGKIGYIYVPSTGIDGQNELVRQFYGQWDKEGLIIDERFNNGGQIPDRFIELLNRKPLAYWAVRDGKNWQWPPVGHFGSMAMMINGWSGSGGDAFPDYFKKAGLGPLVGGRTWGGLIGISGAPTLIDGGVVTVPTFRMYNPDGTWFKEGYGVDPDIAVVEDPTLLAKGVDPQLERTIKEVMKMIKEKGEIHPKEPAREDRSRVIRP